MTMWGFLGAHVFMRCTLVSQQARVHHAGDHGHVREEQEHRHVEGMPAQAALRGEAALDDAQVLRGDQHQWDAAH